MHPSIGHRTLLSIALVLTLASCQKKKLGDACVKNGECPTDQCLAVISERVCTKECHSDGECDKGMSCFSSGSAGYGYCAPAITGVHNVGQACTDSTDCDHRMCVRNLMNVGNSSVGVCSKICESNADCGGKECGTGVSQKTKFCKY